MRAFDQGNKKYEGGEPVNDLKLLKKEIEEYLAIEGVQDARNALRAVLGYIEKLEQSALPEAPKWFDEWMNDGGFEKSLFGALNELYGRHHFNMQVWADSLPMGHAELQQIIADILEDGLNSYITKEERYYVVNKSNESLLMRITDTEYTNKVAYSHVRLLNHIFDHGEEELHQFTEKEIKDYDERYWAFAVPVEHIERKFKNEKR